MISSTVDVNGALRTNQSYSDLSAIQNINQLGRKDKNLALEKIARQFEGMLMNMMISTMRSSVDVIADDNPLNSNAVKFHQQMLDHQLALSLSEGRGIGVADAMIEQLQRDYGDTEKLSEAVAAITQNQDWQRHAVTPQQRENFAEQVSTQSIENHFETPEAFIEAMLPVVQPAAEKLGVDPKVLLAQSALETGWGKYVSKDGAGRSSNNLFNIKADSRWQGETVRVSTLEYRDGIAQREYATFRAYESFEDSVADYVDFIANNPRYQQAVSNAAEGERYVQELADAGYATDPHYAQKIQRIVTSENFQTSVAADAEALVE